VSSRSPVRVEQAGAGTCRISSVPVPDRDGATQWTSDERETIESVLPEPASPAAPPALPAGARISSRSVTQARCEVEADPDPSGRPPLSCCNWFEPFRRCLDLEHPPFPAGLRGANHHLAYNCLDRPPAAQAEKTARFWQGEPGDTARLHTTPSCTQAASPLNALWTLGIAKRLVALYMPWPEARHAICCLRPHGCAPFADLVGFSAEACVTV